jgi:hypothetical protein
MMALRAMNKLDSRQERAGMTGLKEGWDIHFLEWQHRQTNILARKAYNHTLPRQFYQGPCQKNQGKA